jgi:hypothetical protein
MDKKTDLPYPFLGRKTEMQIKYFNCLKKINRIAYFDGGVQAPSGFALANSKVYVP